MSPLIYNGVVWSPISGTHHHYRRSDADGHTHYLLGCAACGCLHEQPPDHVLSDSWLCKPCTLEKELSTDET